MKLATGMNWIMEDTFDSSGNVWVTTPGTGNTGDFVITSAADITGSIGSIGVQDPTVVTSTGTLVTSSSGTFVNVSPGNYSVSAAFTVPAHKPASCKVSFDSCLGATSLGLSIKLDNLYYMLSPAYIGNICKYDMAGAIDANFNMTQINLLTLQMTSSVNPDLISGLRLAARALQKYAEVFQTERDLLAAATAAKISLTMIELE